LFNRAMQKLDHAISRASLFLMFFSGFLVLLMAFLSTYGVVRRYVFENPEPYSYELTTIFLLLCGVLAVAGVEVLDRHVRNDIIASRFPSRMKVIVLDTIFPLIALIFCAVLTWKSLGNALYALQIGQVSNSPWAVPLAPIKFVIPFGYILLCLVLISKFHRGVVLLRGGKEPNQAENQDQIS
jgi:TRAP-type mannitol/chloroaromatic compound transport system permease small subunit